MTDQTKNKSFILHIDSLEVLDQLSDDQAGKLFKAIKEYMMSNKQDHEDQIISLVLHQFLIYSKKYKKSLRGGSYHWNWKGGKSKQSAIIRQSSENKNWRKSVFKRDGYTCQKCNAKDKKIHAHHKKEFAKYPELRFELSNGITLCIECHRFIHSKAYIRQKPDGFF